jgi:hypothetical protein
VERQIALIGKQMIRTHLSIVFVIMTALASGSEMENSYYDCISDGQGSEEQKRACIMRFQRPLPQSVVADITGPGRYFESSGLFRGTIRNYSSEWLITEIVVIMYPDGRLGEEHEYRTPVEAEPDFRYVFFIAVDFGVGKSESFTWELRAAYGVPAN